MESENKTLINISINNDGYLNFIMDEAIIDLDNNTLSIIAVKLDQMKLNLYNLISEIETCNKEHCDENNEENIDD